MQNPLCDVGYMKKTLQKHEFHFSKAKGQNFLIDQDIPSRMASGITKDMGVIEIGPGFGALTYALAEKAGKVVALETDRLLAPILQENLSVFDNVEILQCDALRQDINGLIDERMQGLVPIAVSNLPYAFTSEMLELLINADKLESFTVMVQREVAHRICADCGTKNYGRMTIFSQVYGQAEILFDVPPESFTPRPTVFSSVFRWTRRDKSLVPKDLEKMFFRLVRHSFMQRRKTLANSIFPVVADKMDKTELAGRLTANGIDPCRRGETLSIDEFLILAKNLVPV